MTTPPAGIVSRFDLFWARFDRQYSYWAHKAIDWDSLRRVYRPRTKAATAQEELVGILKAMVAPLRDVHVRCTTPGGTQQSTYLPAAARNWSRDLWLHTIAGCPFRQARPDLGFCTMGGFAYIVVGSWSPSLFSSADIDAGRPLVPPDSGNGC